MIEVLQNINPVLIISVLIVVMLIGVILWQRHKINDMEEAMKPRYGFLGKSLNAFFLFSILVGGLTLTYYASENIQDPDALADKSVDVIVRTEIKEETEFGYIVSFNAVPVVNNIEWDGGNNTKFDLFWYIIKVDGTQKLQMEQRAELDLNYLNQGGFDFELPSGKYEVHINLLFKYGKKTKVVEFEL